MAIKKNIKPGANGCGCQTGPLKYFKPPYATYFKAPCEVHDNLYDMGGTGADRRVADKTLLRLMKNKVNRDKCSWAEKQWKKFIAYSYYGAVRLCGWMFFNSTNG